MKKKMTKEDKYDLIIIGAGVAGLAGAMYAARLGLKTLVFGESHGSEMPIGGIITTTDKVENYPGFEGISGLDLAEKIKKHASSYELVTIKQELVNNIEKIGNGFLVKTLRNKYFGKTIIFATGSAWRKLNISGAKEFENKGISYCALCDALLYKNKVVAVIGGSDAAIKETLVLAEHAKKVYIIYRGEKIRAEPISLKRVQSNKKIEIITKTNVIEIKGDNSVKKIILDKNYKGKNELEVRGVFIAIGQEPLSELAEKIGVKTNEKGEIIINYENCETNVPGVYAAGDVTNKKFKQAIIGVAEGCNAAHSAFEFLKNNIM